jgi:hypothetical protein
MAERFGGKFSPVPREGQAPPRKGRVKGAGRINILYLASFAFLFTGFDEEPLYLATHIAAFGALLFGAWLTREGLAADEAYAARAVARRPAIPRKFFGGLFAAAALFLGAIGPETGYINGAILAGLGFVLHFAAFGADPWRSKGIAGAEDFQSNRVARALDEAEAHLAAMREAIAQTGDRALLARVEHFQATAREMFRSVESDPADLVAARRYLGVYLQGARDATVKFAELWARTREPKARIDYETLLSDLEINFKALTGKLLADERSALDIEIEVLRERLQREGIRAPDNSE